MFVKAQIVDCRNHMLGRLASTVAKELLKGQKIVLVRTEEIVVSGSLFRNRLRLSHDLGKRMLSNPKKGPLHYRSPARMVWRVIRGMMPHKTKKGALSLERLTVFEGIPHPFDKMKRSVMPLALKNIKVRPGRKSCRLGDLAKSIGWHHNDLVDRLETKRKTKAGAWYTAKKELAKLKVKAIANSAAKLAPINEQLAKFGY